MTIAHRTRASNLTFNCLRIPWIDNYLLLAMIDTPDTKT